MQRLAIRDHDGSIDPVATAMFLFIGVVVAMIAAPFAVDIFGWYTGINFGIAGWFVLGAFIAAFTYWRFWRAANLRT